MFHKMHVWKNMLYRLPYGSMETTKEVEDFSATISAVIATLIFKRRVEPGRAIDDVELLLAMPEK